MILSPKTKAYMDYKYDSSNPIGQTFAGYNPTDDTGQKRLKRWLILNI
jgi:hypothetical protein